MKARIQRSQIRYYVGEDNPENGIRDRLQFDVQFTDYPDLPTYGISVDITGLTTQQELYDAIVPEIQALVSRVETQIQNDATARNHFDNWGWSNTVFETDNL